MVYICEVTSSHFTSLHSTSPHLTSLHSTSSHFTSLHSTSPNLTSLENVHRTVRVDINNGAGVVQSKTNS